MPQLPSGRHVGISYDRLMDAVEQKEHLNPLLVMAFSKTENLLSLIDLVYYKGADEEEYSGEPTGEPYLAELTISDVMEGNCDWSDADQTDFMQWVDGPEVQQWLESLRVEVEEKLRGKPLPEALKGILDDDEI